VKHKPEIHKGRPWQKEPWVWFIIFIPSSAVIGGFITLWLAISSDDGLVVDDYYKQGKEINRVIKRDQAAKHHKLVANIALDHKNQLVRLELHARPSYVLPAEIPLRFLHATRSGLDVLTNLTINNEYLYSAPLPQLGPGLWYIQLEADDWRLLGTLQIPQASALQINASR